VFAPVQKPIGHAGEGLIDQHEAASGDCQGMMEDVIGHAECRVEIPFHIDCAVNEGFAERDFIGVMQQSVQRGRVRDAQSEGGGMVARGAPLPLGSAQNEGGLPVIAKESVEMMGWTRGESSEGHDLPRMFRREGR